MSVVFQRSTGKMTAEKFLVLSLTLLFFQGISGTPFSQVYVRSSSESLPLGYVSYGAPPVPITDSQITEISASPAVSSVVTTCVTPCIVPASSLDMAPLMSGSKGKVLAYNSAASNTPIVLAPTNDEKSSYEYSYVVYDENTGDQKEQRELSDGSVVQGHYSFLQPDGYVREVKYTADDLKGFKAVVRKFWPTFGSTDSKDGIAIEKSNDLTALCNKLKNEPLQEAPKDDSKKTDNDDTKSDVTQESLSTTTPTPPASDLLSTESHSTSPTPTEQKTSENPVTESPTEESEKASTEVVSESPVTEKTALESNNIDSTEPTEPSETKPPTDTDTTKSSSEIGGGTNISIASGIATYSDIVRCLQTAFEDAKKSSEASKTSLTYIILPSKRC